jgi:hypothetical protein
MGDRRPTRGLNNRVRERLAYDRDAEFMRLIESRDYSAGTMERLAELLGRLGPRKYG